MNKRILYFILAGVFGVFLVVSIVAGVSMYEIGKDSVEKHSREIHQTYLTEVVSNFRNDLVSGNYRFFRNQISSLIEHGAFSEYALVQDGKIIDSTDGYLASMNDGNRFSFLTVPIWFDSERASKWGEVRLALDERSERAYQSKLLESLQYLVMVILIFSMILTVVAVSFWHRINSSLNKEISAVFGQKLSGADRGSLAGALWKPALDTLRLNKVEYDIAKEEAAKVGNAAALMELSRQVSHDIRSPLSALNIAMSQIHDLPDGRAAIIRNAAQRINEIANDLLKRKDTSAVRQTLDATAQKHSQEVELKSLIENIVIEKRVQVTDKRITIDTDFDSAPTSFVEGDGKEIQRVLSNIINNSIEALDVSGGIVRVSLRTFKDSVRMTVQDNGKGIPPEILARLGEPGLTFGKQNTTSGNGLGISHAKNYVESLGGRFSVASQLENGTIVQIQLKSSSRSNS